MRKRIFSHKKRQIKVIKLIKTALIHSTVLQLSTDAHEDKKDQHLFHAVVYLLLSSSPSKCLDRKDSAKRPDKWSFGCEKMGFCPKFALVKTKQTVLACKLQISKH